MPRPAKPKAPDDWEGIMKRMREEIATLRKDLETAEAQRDKYLDQANTLWDVLRIALKR
jgi:hypothetical protein